MRERKGRSYRLRLLCLHRLVSRRTSVFGVVLRQLSGNQKSRHSLSGVQTDLPVKSREVAIKLTLKKKRDGIVNFLSSFLAWPRVLSRSFFLFFFHHPLGVHIANSILSNPFRAVLSCRSRAGNDITHFTLKTAVQ